MTMTCIALNEEIIAVTKDLYIDCYDGENHKIINVTSNNSQKDDKITDIVISSDGKYLAVITSSTKKLIVYNLPTFKEEKVYALPRSASKIRFTVDNSNILVADKTGDGLLYDISSVDSGTKLLGHLSLLLNILQSEDGKYIITSDRDEKIRVTCYPKTYVIHTYCLGHVEFVNHIELLPHNAKYLISTSGDGTVRCWDYEKGKLCHTIDTYLDVKDESLLEEFKKIMDKEGVEVERLPVVLFTIDKLNVSCSVIALCIHLIKKVFLYTIEFHNEQFVHKLICTLDINYEPMGIKIYNSSLFIYFSNCEISEYKIQTNNLQITVDFVKKLNVFNNIDKSSLNCNFETSIKVLYKRKFDNVQEYQERKKQRLGILK